MPFRKIKPRVAVEAVLWIALASFIGSRMWPQIAAAFGVASANARAPQFQLTTLAGEPISTESLHGKVVLLNFWATWCGPCRIEMPGFERIYERNRARGFVIVGVSTDAVGTGQVESFLRERGITYPVAMANGGVVSAFGGVNTLPMSFLIDRDGRIRNEVRGVFAPVALDQAVERLLADAPADGAR